MGEIPCQQWHLKVRVCTPSNTYQQLCSLLLTSLVVDSSIEDLGESFAPPSELVRMRYVDHCDNKALTFFISSQTSRFFVGSRNR